MFERVRSSAPGKLMLFGEHAVIYNYPCLVTAVDIRTSVTLEKRTDAQIVISTPQLRAEQITYQSSVEAILARTIHEKRTSFVEYALHHFYRQHGIASGLSIYTEGVEQSYGLGTSASISAAMALGLATLFEIPHTPRDLFDLAYRATLSAQGGTGSGFDVASSVYGGTLYFLTGGQVIDPLPAVPMPLMLIYSGQKVGTVNLVKQVEAQYYAQKALMGALLASIAEIVASAKEALLAHEWVTLGHLADLNQASLEYFGVSTPHLNTLIHTARIQGAYGAKLSGAGGGDCLFAFVPAERWNAVASAVMQAGGQVLNFPLHAEGVRLEPS